MHTGSRRRFLIQSGQAGAAALAPAWLARRARANPLGRPVGLQLYTVKEAMLADPIGTLKKLRDIGFGEVESAGFGKRSAKEFRGLLDDAGLACPSAHLSFDVNNLDASFEDAHALGAAYATSGALVADRATNAPWPPTMNLDQAKRTAELVNRIGAAAKRAALQYVYHNHDFEFADQGGGVTSYDVLLRETDPELVKFEVDCGWMIFAGRNPIDYFMKYPHRFPMIHVKDFLPAPAASAAARGAVAGGAREMLGAELGRGVIDYKPIFAAAEKAGLRHYFVEQEGPFSRMNPLQAVQVDYDYLHSLK
ncbi:MAG TPA: sugar phosphate isomerase/epimerase [Steroidobacteraceae bacterium]|nr:sugar phosphate isomerase/epimerase [Steroidobacteraceae bacterium]